jgi:hypothetical protein
LDYLQAKEASGMPMPMVPPDKFVNESSTRPATNDAAALLTDLHQRVPKI